jgi:hypothetical protein
MLKTKLKTFKETFKKKNHNFSHNLSLNPNPNYILSPYFTAKIITPRRKRKNEKLQDKNIKED